MAILIDILFPAAIVYTVVGIAVAVMAHARLLKHWDPAAARGHFAFRMLITPGLIALWPFVLHRAFARRAT
ncbi:MAG: hypothetical protein PSX37_04530 [bacterium]|nr:hypothetical protein [bacterium]